MDALFQGTHTQREMRERKREIGPLEFFGREAAVPSLLSQLTSLHVGKCTHTYNRIDGVYSYIGIGITKAN